MEPLLSCTRAALVGVLGVVCFACSGKMASATKDGTSADASLTIPLGVYTGCATTLVNIAGNSEGTSGGDGTVTLSADGKGSISGVLAFDQWLNGTVAFTPTNGTTAVLTAGPFELQAPTGIGMGALAIPVSAGSLVLVHDTLLISVYGESDQTKLSGYVTCPVPASLPSATIVNPAPATGSIATGTYAGCTSSLGYGASTLSGGDLSLTIAEGSGTLTATSGAGFPAVCPLAFDDTSGTTAPLSDAQTCAISEPCGPPPSLGTSSAPSETTLTNMAGSIQVSSGALFINVVGDAPADACGSHMLSLICPTEP
jgi:hypothetical protein